jgi:hypothetical protein
MQTVANTEPSIVNNVAPNIDPTRNGGLAATTNTVIQYVPLVATTNQKFMDYEINELLTIIKQLLPCGKPEWEHVAKELNKVDGVRVRSHDNLRRKLTHLQVHLHLLVME